MVSAAVLAVLKDARRVPPTQITLGAAGCAEIREEVEADGEKL